MTISFYTAFELSRQLRNKNYEATETRWALANFYDNHPDRAIAHVNVKLDAASRGEEERAQNLEVFAE